MSYIEVSSGSQRLYIEKEKLSAIVDSPRVHRVPGQTAEAAGISYYMGKPVVYYLPAASCGTAFENYRCGIILKCEAGFIGILAETAGEVNAVSEELEQVIQGVWVKKSD